MNKIVASILLVTVVCGFQQTQGITIEKEEATKAFLLLTDIRANPDKYYQEIGFEKDTKVSNVALTWNDTLAKVAEAKAYDMAKRNYFAHVDPDGYGINYFIEAAGYKLNPEWTAEKSTNFFESLSVNNQTGEDAIRRLIKDANTPTLGHRKHLLGLDEWNGKMKDIGIGFCTSNSGSRFKTYACIIIARHDW